jgi:hypothetical protein
MVDLTNSSTARGLVATWLTDNHQRFGLRQIRMAVAEDPAQILTARYETPQHLLDICVWEHGFCLDILVFEQSSGETVFSAAGPCDCLTVMSDRLELLSNWVVGLHTAPN